MEWMLYRLFKILIMKRFQDIPDLYASVASQNALSLAKAKIAKDKLKQKLAALTAKIMAEEDIPTSRAEAKARASTEYLQFLTDCQGELEKAEIAKAEMKSLEMAFEYYRTKNATERAKMKLL